MAMSVDKKKRLLGEARGLFSAGRYGAAAEAYGTLVREEPRNAGLVFNLGSALMLAGDAPAGVKHLTRAVGLKPGDPEALAQLSLCQRLLGKMDDAERASAKAVEAGPANPFACWARADLLRILGRYEEAHALLRPLVVDDGEGVDATLLIVYAGVAWRFEGADRSVGVLRRLLGRGDLPAATRAEALFELGKILDREKRYDEAFESFEEANGIRKGRWPADEFTTGVDAMIGAWTPGLIARLPRSGITDERPVFVVGMMRSGSTLCEQILSSHPLVFPGGEMHFMRDAHENLLGAHGGDVSRAEEAGAINAKSLARAGRAYLQKIGKAAGRDAARVTDKMPYNWRHLGLISLMFPKARVIHTVRDPLDTCVSCYANDFIGAHAYCNDLEWLGTYARETSRVMEHWKRVLDIPVHTLVYEELLSDQERVTRGLIEFLGLEWDDACLRFHENRRAAITRSNEQVREKLFTSSRGRHANYAKHLAPLREALGV